MEDIVLIHRRSNKKISSPFSTFTTCLRQIVFVPSTADLQNSNIHLDHDDEVLEKQTATRFLIEVLSGLHSPLIGETEVFGQFKKFYDETFSQESHSLPGINKWLQFIFQQVKSIRSTHLTHLGSSCYGSLARRFLKEQTHVVFFGSGQLAHEIVPWLAEKTNLQIFCRDPEKIRGAWQGLKNTNLNFTNYASSTLLQGALIIAAPMSDQCVISELKKRQFSPSIILDLRSAREKESNQLSQSHSTRYVDLETFFATFQENRNKNQTIVAQAKSEIVKMAHDFSLRAEVRPLGWDDICA